MKKCVLLCNNYSGKKNKKNYIEEFLKILKNNNYDTEVIESKYKAHIVDIVKELNDNIDLVISIGGDGTFNEAMRGNFQRKKRIVLAHIPMGTTNDVGKMLGYAKDPINNLKLLMDGVVKNIDVCTINNVPFIYVAGFGKFMNIPYETKRKSKKKFGYLAYVFNGVKNFFRFTKMHDITYKIDNETYSGPYSFLAITNATRIAGVKLFDNIKLDDGKFEILFCNIKKRKDIIKSLIRLRKTDITHVPGFYFHTSNNLKITINDEKDLPWCLDGEKYDSDERYYEIDTKKKVQMLIPEKNVEKLFLHK
jgi:YegS/Rv2252/BmrU family lipid kinase